MSTTLKLKDAFQIVSFQYVSSKLSYTLIQNLLIVICGNAEVRFGAESHGTPHPRKISLFPVCHFSSSEKLPLR
jgi:hypothetical protein